MTEQDWIYTLNDGVLERIPYKAYADEASLQDLISNHPHLLAGELIDPDNPPHWFLIGSETGIPDTSDGSDRWSIDHLLIDQWGRPTFVEVKRSTDTRIRREVVGQMLDYAANALAYWPTDRVREIAVETAGSSEKLEKDLADFLAIDVESESEENAIEAFWSEVHRHLANGEVRLMFVADEIPTELRRVIEFLNDHMAAIEVLGIEIRQYQGDNLKALVPRVVGQTEFARQSKNSDKPRTKPKLTEEQFLARCPVEARRFFERMIGEAAEHRMLVIWGTTGFSLRIQRPDDIWASLAYGALAENYTDGNVHLEIYFAQLTSADDPETIRSQLLEAAPFKERGRYTLDLVLDSENIGYANRILPLLWDAAATVSQTPWDQ